MKRRLTEKQRLFVAHYVAGGDARAAAIAAGYANGERDTLRDIMASPAVVDHLFDRLGHKIDRKPLPTAADVLERIDALAREPGTKPETRLRALEVILRDLRRQERHGTAAVDGFRTHDDLRAQADALLGDADAKDGDDDGGETKH